LPVPLAITLYQLTGNTVKRGIKGVRLINNLFPLGRGREASPLFEGA